MEHRKKSQAQKVVSCTPHAEIVPAFQLSGHPVTSDQCSFGVGVEISVFISIVLTAFAALAPWIRLCL